MTDRSNPYVLGKGRLYFEPVRRYPADALTLRNYQMSGKLAEHFYEQWLDANFILRVISIIGYNPQMLLPAPDKRRTMRERLDAWANHEDLAAHGLKTLRDATSGVVDFETPADRRYYPLYTPEGRPNVERWNDPDATPLEDLKKWIVNPIVPIEPKPNPFEDIDRFRELMTSVQDDIALVIGTDFGGVERKVLQYMHATFIHESDLHNKRPVGKIELFDYDDHAVIVLEGSGELPGRRDLVDDLFSGQFARQLGKTASMTAMMRKLERRPAPQKSYLDHDPTKRHKRSKRR